METGTPTRISPCVLSSVCKKILMEKNAKLLFLFPNPIILTLIKKKINGEQIVES